MSMMQAPVLRGSFKDSLPSDLRELADWLNYRLRGKETPLCGKCKHPRHVTYDPKAHILTWWCVNHKRCHSKPFPVDESKVYKYAKSRLRHNPENCFRQSFA